MSGIRVRSNKMTEKPLKRISKLQMISLLSVLWVVFFVSYTWSGYLDFIPQIRYIHEGFNVLEGLSDSQTGSMWRLNQTYYIVDSKGQIIYVESTIPLGNYSTCYGLAFIISRGQTYQVSIGETTIPVNTETACMNYG